MRDSRARISGLMPLNPASVKQGSISSISRHILAEYV